MADVLENLTSGRISLDDFNHWLISDSVENCAEKANFITYFVNYIKEECAWLISKNVKKLESPFKLTQDQQIDAKESYIIDKKLIKNLQSTIKNENYDKNKAAENYSHNNKKNNYQERTKVEDYLSKPEFLSIEQPKFSHKNQISAKKHLNFNKVSDTKTNASCGRMFEGNIKSLEAFPPLGESMIEKKSQDLKVRRRITPTPIKSINKNSLKFGTSTFAVPTEKVPNEVFKRTPFMEAPCCDLQNEREMLKITRNKLSHSTAISNICNDLKSESVSPMKCITVNYIVPDPEKVIYEDKLRIYFCIYGELLANALVPNVISELYFVFELVTSKVSSESKCNDINNVFCTVHNCMYFGVNVLNKLQALLNLLDKSTLNSLHEIPFLLKFSPELSKFLQSCFEEKQEITSKPLSLNRVPFFVEEDSRENFMDAHSFSSFRKQRDLFYELLRDWQHQSFNNIDVKFQESFSRKAKILISLGPNAVNIHHLARLFQNQLIASCLGFEVNEVYDDFLTDIQKNFPGKFEKLRQRFMMPFCVGEPNPPPTFYGIQSFFCELIHAAASPMLNQQLQDIFVCKILDFNQTDICSDGELNSVNIVKEKYLFLLHTLRILAKFLGYLYFLPYKIAEPLPISFVANQLKSRKKSVPPIDILQLLKTAIENNRVILTVPWIIEYLSMIDPIAKNLVYIEETLTVLIEIYRGNYLFSSSCLSFWFLRIIIGWLFDVLCYPPKYSSLLLAKKLENHSTCKGLDQLNIIDKQLVHSCCPYLIEFKVLVYNYVNGIKSNNRREIRKITPLSTTKQRVSTSLTKQQTEIQLEENFFFLHPPSLRKTVEFVSERMASKVINRIRSEVTDFKLYTVKHITSQERYKALLNTKSNANKLKSHVDSCILELYEKSQSKIAEFINVSCQKDIKHIVPYLLSDDVKPSVVEMCSTISFRRAVDKIVDWCDSNLILVDIMKDIKNKLAHLSKGEGNATKEKNIDVSSIIISLRQFIIDFHSISGKTSRDYTKILSEVSSVTRKEIGSTAKKLIVNLTLDLYIALIIYIPEKYDELREHFIDIWSLCPKDYDLEYSYLAVYNIKMISVGKHFEMSCKTFIHMFTFFINKNIFQKEKIKICLTKLNSLQWKDSRCEKILSLLSEVCF